MKLLPVLSDEELKAIRPDIPMCGQTVFDCEGCSGGCRLVAQAQRKADLIWLIEWLEKRMDTCGEHGPYFCIAKANLDSLKKEEK